ncbi:hypothetical protein [Phycicoccus sonneratiae]|uniref:DUF4190 domain-containing protein n=1 Tax=Phycicoccus sonneratiae TaxID=2807628 RepID=A0ABS2CQQ5_9MICO|nr:hypothetical protein [Phycicoccus sonneraticus]MBM6402209.1 hypothetical protein [Phycicoccus sonneraticus]
MNSLTLALEGAGKVLGAGLVFGAGLPVVYALAMRLLTIGATPADGDTAPHYTPLGRALAGLLILVVAGGVVLGLVLIVASGFGKAVSFENILPTIVDKK